MTSVTTKTDELAWPRCDWCRRPAVPADWPHEKRDKSRTAVCPRCVSLIFCRMAIVRHGPLGDRPQSRHFQGHERRLAEHELRIAAGVVS